MDGAAGAGPRPAHLLRLAGVWLGALVLVAVVGLAAVALWLRTYAPLGVLGSDYAPGPGIGSVIAPAVGSGGKDVFFPAYRRGRQFEASFTLRNGGHFSVTLEGLAADPPGPAPSVAPSELLATAGISQQAPIGHTLAFRPFVLAPGDTVALVARFRLACPSGGGRVTSVFADSLRLRYRYLRWFERTQVVTLPYAVTLRCVHGPLANP